MGLRQFSATIPTGVKILKEIPDRVDLSESTTEELKN